MNPRGISKKFHQLVITHNYSAPADMNIFVNPSGSGVTYKVVKITARPRVVGSDGSAVTAEIRKAASGTAPASGTILHSGTIDLKGTVDTDQNLTLVNADCKIPPGTAICLDPSGTTTAATGVISIVLQPLIP